MPRAIIITLFIVCTLFIFIMLGLAFWVYGNLKSENELLQHSNETLNKTLETLQKDLQDQQEVLERLRGKSNQIKENTKIVTKYVKSAYKENKDLIKSYNIMLDNLYGKKG